MKIYRNSIFVNVPAKIKKKLLVLLIIDNSQRIFVLSTIGIFFFFLFIFLDLVRYDAGKLQDVNLYFYLWINHLSFILFTIPITIILRNRPAFSTGRYKHSKLFIYSWTLFLGVILIIMAILSFIDRGSLTMYFIYIIIANFGLIMLHWDRLMLNVISFVIISMVIIILYHQQLERLIVLLMESTGVSVLSFMVSTKMFNDYVEKVLGDYVIEKKQKRIKIERKKSKALLHNILPKSIARELKIKGRVKPRHFSSATVMLIDFAGFSRVSKMLLPEDLIYKLDFCFRNFDRITIEHRLEKIKTIGDAYLCVGGVPESNLSHPSDCIEAGFAILAFMEDWKTKQQAKKEAYFDVRIGIHTGPVIAGVVGDQKFAFDIWGDTVNITARIETAGEAGRINISQDTFDLLQDRYDCSYRGAVNVKGYTPIGMHFVEKLQ
jgi:class 3 adenylate cyclase